jgi:hypothetical protein
MKHLQLTVLAVLISFNLFAITRSKSIDPIVISTNLSKEQVWQRLIGLFVGNSIPIKLMDKSSGLIQSESLGLGSHYALKHADDSLAWALCETVRSPEGDSFYLFPQVIDGELQVYVQETVDGKTLLSVNLMNLKATYRDLTTENEREYMIESTKRLENLIGDYLKTYEQMPSLNFDSPLSTFGEAPSQTARREALALKRAKHYQELLKLDNEKWDKEHEVQEERKNFRALIFGGVLVVAIIVLRLLVK